MTSKWFFTALLLLLTGIAQAETSPPFLEAQDAFRRGQVQRLANAAAKLTNHPLSSYIDYYQLRMRIDVAPESEIKAFLTRHADAYIGEAMRIDWLHYLARQGRWEAFDLDLPKLVQPPEPDLRCRAFEARRQRPDAALASDLRQFWIVTPDLPEICESFFASMIKLKLLPEKGIWQRARRQIDQGRLNQARRTLTFLPGKPLIDQRIWTSLTRHPVGLLDRIDARRPIKAFDQEIAALAILNLGRQTVDGAATHLTRLAPRLDPEDRSRLWAALATKAAGEHHPKARQWFDAAKGLALTDEQARWRARAALRAGDFEQVSEAIGAMPLNVAEETPWIYWQGRALQARGLTDAADFQFGRIASQNGFYGVLAAEELGLRVSIPPRAVPPTDEELEQVAAIPAIQRALGLFELNLRIEAVREWAWALRGMTDRQLLAISEFARRRHIFDRAIGAAVLTQNEHDYSLRYLTPHLETVRPAAKLALLDDAWVYGLMRQESRFISDSRSTAGAQGLMQVMPATARWVARKIGLADYRASQINDLAVNVKLGTSYLQLVYESLDRSPVLASAAYNAGPGRARRWRDPERSLEGAVYIETIPFGETRDYVRKVMVNAVFYSALLNGRADSLKARLGVIRRAIESDVPGEPSAPAKEELP